MDSTVLLYDLIGEGRKIHCALFDYGQKHVKELEFAKWHCEWQKVPFTLISIPQLRGSELTDGSGSVIVPNRNAILLNLAVNLAIAEGANRVTFAANADDEETFPDCRRAFVNAMNANIKAAGYDVMITAPYLTKGKWWIAAVARDMKVPLSETWSCYRDGVKPCGECLACLKRDAALKRKRK